LLVVISSGAAFGIFWKLAQITLISPEIKQLYPIHLYADSAIRTVLFFVALWLVFSYFVHWLLKIEIGIALKTDAMGFAALALTLLLYYLFLDVRVVHPMLGKIFLFSKFLHFIFVPHDELWKKLLRRKTYIIDISLIFFLFGLIFLHMIPPSVDKFLYFRDVVSMGQSIRTTLTAINGVRYFDAHLWDSFMNAGSTPITFFSTVQYHSLGLLDTLLGFTSFDFFNNHQLGNYMGYTFLALLLFSWVSVYLFLRSLRFSRFASYLLGLAYPFTAIFHFINFESEVTYQALIFPFLAFCTLRMLRKKTIASALWLSLITAILVHYTYNFPTPPYFAHTYMFLIGWIGFMVIVRKGERGRYAILLFTFLISHILLFAPKLLALYEFVPKLPGLQPHGYNTVSYWQGLLGVYHNIIRFFYFGVGPYNELMLRRWYHLLTPVTFLALTGAYAYFYQKRPEFFARWDTTRLSIMYFFGYAILYFFFQIIYEPSIIQAWLYHIHQITLVHYTFNTGHTFTLCILVIAAVGLDWFVSQVRESERRYVPVIVFNILLLLTGVLLLLYPISIDSQGVWKEGMTIDSRVLGEMAFIIISTNLMIYLLRARAFLPAFGNVMVTAVFVIYITHVMQPYLKYDKFIDGTKDRECETPLKYYAYYLKNNPHDILTDRYFRERALFIIKGGNDMLDRTISGDNSDAYFNEFILNRGLYPPGCASLPKDRLSLANSNPLHLLEFYHTRGDYRNYRYSTIDYMLLPHKAHTLLANSFPFFLTHTDDGPKCLIPREMVPFNQYRGGKDRTGNRQFYCTLNLEYHLRRPYLMDIVGIKYVYVSKKAYNAYKLHDNDKFRLINKKGLMFLENKDVKPIAYLASKYRLMTDAEKEMDIPQLRALKLEPDKLLLASDPGIKNSSSNDSGEKSFFPPVEIVNARFNWAVFRVKGNPKESLLFHSDSFDKDWNGYIDKKKTDIYRTQLAFKSVVVPPGDHLVWFEYRPGSFIYGAYIFCLTIIGIALSAIRKIDTDRSSL
jgi:hypothetical protein